MATTKKSPSQKKTKKTAHPSSQKSHTTQTTASKKSAQSSTTKQDDGFSFAKVQQSSSYRIARKALPYVIALIGICIVLLFFLQRLSAAYGQFCGEYTSEYAYVDDCTCIGVKSVVPTDVGEQTYEIRCLGFKTSCHREYMVWPKTEPIECAQE